MEEDNNQRIQEMNELKLSEQEIKEDIFKQGPTEIKFKRYGLINKDWVEKYKKFYNFDDFIKSKKINPNQNGENIFILKDLIPSFESRLLKDNNEKNRFNVNLPSNFTIVNENFIKLISKNINKELKETPQGKSNEITSMDIESVETPTPEDTTDAIDNNHQQIKEVNDLVFEAIIGGGCIIIKDKKNERSFFIELYIGNKDKNKNQNNFLKPDSIHFFINFKEKSMEEELKIILTKGIGNYFIKNNLDSFICHEILSNNQSIGFIYNFTCKDYGSTQIVMDIDFHLKKDKKKNINYNFNPYFSSILICLYQIDNLRSFFSKINSNINYKENTRLFYDFFKNFNSNPIQSLSSIEKHMLKSEKIENFEKIIQTIISKLDLELTENKKDEESQLNQVNQYDEKTQKEIILKKYNNGSIFHKTFNSIKEKIILCQECNMNFYSFEFMLFFKIDLDKETKNINLTEKIFESKKIEENLKCNMCQKETKSSVEEKISGHSPILIIIIKGNKEKYFNIKENLNLNNNQKNLQYNLFCFVDRDFKIYTFRYYNNKGAWYKYDDNYQKYNHEINNENPIVLFYNLIQFNNNINNNININNKSNMNNMNNMFNNINMNNFNNIIYNNAINNMLKINLNSKTGNNQINNQQINNNNNNNINNNKEIDDYFEEDDDKNPLFVTFTIEKDNKQIYLDVHEDMKFKEVKNKLENKYNWLQKIKDRTYYFKHKKIDENETLKNLRILDNSNVIIRV